MKNSLDEKIAMKKKKIKWNKQKSSNNLLKAEKLIKEKNLQSAKKLLSETLNFDPEHIDSLNNLAVVNILENNIDNAYDLPCTILRIEPANEIAINNIKYIGENKLLTTLKAKQRRNIKVCILDEPERTYGLFGSTFDILGINPIYLNLEEPEKINEVNPDIILLSREWSYSWRIAVANAIKAKIPVLYVMDGIIEWSYIWNNLSYVRPEGTVLQPLIANHISVIGRHPARILSSIGLAEKIHVIGLPRLDKLNSVRKVDHLAKPKILISTAKTFAHNIEQKIMVRRALRDLKEYFESNPDIQPVWRISEDIAADVSIIPQTFGTLEEELSLVNALISFTSTCLLEGMIKGIPTAQIDYRPTPEYFQTAWNIKCAEHIESTIQELLYPPPEKIAYQNYLLNDEFEMGQASERLAELIENIIYKKEEKISTNKKVVFGKLDYRQVHSELSAFAISPQSVLQYELDATYNLLDVFRKESKRKDGEIANCFNSIREKEETIHKLIIDNAVKDNTIEQLDLISRDLQSKINILDSILKEREDELNNVHKENNIA